MTVPTSPSNICIRSATCHPNSLNLSCGVKCSRSSHDTWLSACLLRVSHHEIPVPLTVVKGSIQHVASYCQNKNVQKHKMPWVCHTILGVEPCNSMLFSCKQPRDPLRIYPSATLETLGNILLGLVRHNLTKVRTAILGLLTLCTSGA
jgi:hypothetical protein